MVPEDMLRTLLRKRISEFGEQPSYILYPEELRLGGEHRIFTIASSENRGDGTTITATTFEGRSFLCVTETQKE